MPSSPPQKTARFLQETAKQSNIVLPPLGFAPKWWPKAMRAPKGQAPKLDTKPGKFLSALLKRNLGALIVQSCFLTISSVGGAFVPLLLGAVVTSLTDTSGSNQTLQLIVVLAILVVVMGVAEGLAQLGGNAVWLGAAGVCAWAVGQKVTKAGRGIRKHDVTGNVVTALVNDTSYMGAGFYWIAEGASSLAATVTVMVLMFKTSTPLAWVVAIVTPVILVIVSAAAKPLEKKLGQRRQVQGQVTAVATDAVVGLRILRGIGGEGAYNNRYQQKSQELKDAGIQAARPQAMVSMLRDSSPQLIVAIVLLFGANLAYRGELSSGELVAFFGYAWYLRIPVGAVAEIVHTWTGGWVATKRLAKIYGIKPLVDDNQVDDSLPYPDWDKATLQVGEVEVQPNKLTVIASTTPEAGAKIAEKLARIDDAEENASLDGVNLQKYPLAWVREGIYLSEANAQVFRDSLQDSLEGKEAPMPQRRGTAELIYREHLENFATTEDSLFVPEPTRENPDIEAAIAVADAADVVSSLEAGLAGEFAEKGRNVSGGQRQRVALARAVYTQSPVLVLVQPTSAVDAHTEKRIVERLADARRDKTTVVVSASPMFLSAADVVIAVDDEGNVLAKGKHEDLMAKGRAGEAGAARYVDLVSREVDTDA